MNEFFELYRYTQEGLLDLYEHCLEEPSLTYHDINIPLLLPYMHVENRNFVCLDMYERGLDISNLAGFVTVEGYRSLVKRMIKTAMMPVGLDKHIHFLLPELVDELIMLAKETGKIGDIEVSKFLNQATQKGRDQFVDDILFEGPLDVKEYINFASPKMRHRIALYAVNDTLKKVNIDEIITALSPEDRKLIKEHREHREQQNAKRKRK